MARGVFNLCCSVQDLQLRRVGSQLWRVGSSSLTRDGTWALALGVRSLSHWTTREVLKVVFLEVYMVVLILQMRKLRPRGARR